MCSELPQQQLAALEGRRFSFYPAIRGIKHNEWTVGEATWAEVQVCNCASDQELWIPKRHLGSVSSSDSPVLIQGLRRELEFKAGGVFPYHRVITEIPSTRAGRERRASASGAPPPREKLFSRADARMLRLLAITVGSGLLLALVGLLGVVGGLHNPLEWLLKPDTSTTDQRYLGLGANDSYFEVVGRLAAAESEQWLSHEDNELQFQALHYPARGYIVIMMGGGRAEMRYLGTIHEPSRRVLDSARLARGGDTSSMMRNLPEF